MDQFAFCRDMFFSWELLSSAHLWATSLWKLLVLMWCKKADCSCSQYDGGKKKLERHLVEHIQYLC